MFWPRGVSSKMGLDGGFKAFFFYRSLGFSRAVCSLSSLTPKAEIQVTNMWMTPLIQTMPDDYSYFCIPITPSLQAHLHAWNALTKHAHTSHLKYLQVRISGVNQFYSALSCGGESKCSGSRSGLGGVDAFALLSCSSAVIHIYDVVRFQQETSDTDQR